MTSDIVTRFELDKEIDSAKVIVVKELNGCDSSFIISCVLGHCIKSRNAVLVVSTHNSLLHYHNVGLKMNYNLQKSVQTGLVQFYDAGRYLVDNIVNECNDSLQDFLIKVKEKIVNMQEKFGSVNVIFDGVSHLLDLRGHLREVNKICSDIVDLVRMFNNSFLIFHCNVAFDEDVTNILANLLSHKSQIVVEVESLSSGLSADVSGHITFKYLYRKFQNEHMYSVDLKPSQYLFKIFDRGVKLLAPGTV